MKILAALVFITAPVMAEIPKHRPLEEYSRLWTDSPFTSRTAGSQESALGPDQGSADSWELIGVSGTSGGYRVTLESREDKGRTLLVTTGEDGPVRIISVQRGKDPADTRVTLSFHGSAVTLKFDDSILTPPAPAAGPGTQPLKAISLPDDE